MSQQDTTYLTATELGPLYRARELSPVLVVEQLFARIERVNVGLNAFVKVDGQAALDAARASEQRFVKGEPLSKLDGVPVSIKDLLPARGFATRRGSRTTSDAPSEHDAPAVARLREAGAIVFAKSTTSEFGLKGAGDSPLTGITRNPFAPEHTPGGSSAGAVTAVAAGLGPIAIGTDGGGSIRVPSAYTGVLGLKPTFGRVAQHPPSFVGVPAHVGPIARCVSDLALVLRTIAAPDPRDPLRAPLREASASDLSVRSLRIGFSPTFDDAEVFPDIARAFADAIAALCERGVSLELVELGFSPSRHVLRTLFAARAAATVRELTPAQRTLLDPAVEAAAREGEQLSAVAYLAAEEARIELVEASARFYQQFDLLLTPATAQPAPAIGQPPPARGDHTPFTYPFSLTRQPALSLPIGQTEAGLPIGLQVVGRHFEDERVLSFAASVESLFPFRAPALTT